MEDSGSTMRIWKKLEAKLKELHFKIAISMTSEFLILKHLSGLDLELVALLQSIDSVIVWTFQDQTSSSSVDGQRLQEQDSNMNHLKKAVITLWYGQLIPCPGKEENILEILQQLGLDTQVQQLVLIYLFLEDGSTQKLKMK